MHRIAHIKTTYLELSETFIYQFLTSFKNTENFVIAEQLKNLDVFPFKNKVLLDPYTRKDFVNSAISRLLSPRHKGFERRIELAIDKVKPDLLHAHFGPVGVYTLPIAKRHHLPLIISFYGYDTSYAGVLRTIPTPRKLLPFGLNNYWKKAYSELFKEVSAIVTFGEVMRETLIDLGAPADIVFDIHSGINLNQRKFSPRLIDKDKPIEILMVNRLVDKKGTEIALRAVSTLCTQYPNISLKIVGGGPLEVHLKDTAADLGIEDHVEFLGFKKYPEVIEMMKTAHVFLSPSIKVQDDEEGGINTTVIDALSLGLPTIATTESGSQLILDHSTRLMSEIGSSEDLAEKIKYLIENPASAQQMAIEGRALIERDFDQEKQTEKLEDLYDHILTPPSSS